MDADELNALLEDSAALLDDLAKIMPKSVDPELVAFLKSIESSPMLVELLLGVLTLHKQAGTQASSRKF